MKCLRSCSRSIDKFHVISRVFLFFFMSERETFCDKREQRSSFVWTIIFENFRNNFESEKSMNRQFTVCARASAALRQQNSNYQFLSDANEANEANEANDPKENRKHCIDFRFCFVWLLPTQSAKIIFKITMAFEAMQLCMRQHRSPATVCVCLRSFNLCLVFLMQNFCFIFIRFAVFLLFVHHFFCCVFLSFSSLMS